MTETSTKELEGRLAIVTGGARGIGKAICLTLAREGASVVIADINLEGAQNVVAEIQHHKGEARAIETDVSSEKSVLNLYEKVMAEYSQLDIVVNDAGICRMIPILDIEVQEWDEIMAVNLRGTFLMSREALRIMKEQQHGRIVNITSAAAKIGGVAAGAHYSASKAGVICLTKSLALQAAPYRVNVNAVCPGPAKTEMTDAWGDEMNEAFRNMIPWKEYGQPQDVAEAVLFLASDRARYITGEILDVNGGLVMD
jgi:3-oxoacyl-[acyl-carrier protein] reductase